MWLAQSPVTDISQIKNYLIRVSPGTRARCQKKRDHNQFNSPSNRTNYIFCNYYSKCHILLNYAM